MIKEIVEKIKKNEIDVEEFVEEKIEKAKEINKELNCFITIAEEEARERAREIKKNIKEGKANGKLLGIPFGVKDNILTKGIRTTAGSRILLNYIPPFSSTAVDRIEKEGAIIIGKTSMDEFGFGSFNINVGIGFEIPKNPIAMDRVCGGSSGGSACATKVLQIPSLAESTGGSISAPSSFCGVVGLTPSYGKVSRFGLIDYASSLDKIGVIANSVEDAFLVYETIKGFDENDETSTSEERDSETKRKLAVPKEVFDSCEEEVKNKFMKKLEKIGWEFEEVSIELLKYSIQSYYIIAMAEASTNLARYKGLVFGAQEEIKDENFREYFSRIRSAYFGNEAKRRILLGSFVRSIGYKGKYYYKALAIRKKLIEEIEKKFKNFDAFVLPAMPIFPLKIEEALSLSPEKVYSLDICTIPWNLCGLPHISIPIKESSYKQLGFEIVCNRFEEEKLKRISLEFEKIISE
ncbi:MAG: amidase family protein [Candidatus Micrarchaeia archaeon]